MSISLVEHCLSFPELDRNQIIRTNLIQYLKDRFCDERRVIVATGPLGAGKTTLLAQFAQANPENSFSFFVGHDYWSSSVGEFLRDVLGQMSVVLRGCPNDLEDWETGRLIQRFHEAYRALRRKAKYSGTSFYFVIDGLELIDSDASEKTILDFLPTEPAQGFYLLASLLAHLPKRLIELISREWEHLPREDDIVKNLLSLATFSEAPLTVSMFAELLGIDVDTVHETLKRSAAFLKADERGIVRFITDAHRRLAEERLLNKKHWAETLLIDHYLHGPTSKESVVHLPRLLQKTGEYSLLKDLVSSDHLLEALDLTKDAFVPLEQLRLVGRVAYDNGDYRMLSLYVLASAIYRELLVGLAASDSEIEAILALGDVQRCLQLADQCLLMDDRLYLLAKTGRYMKDHGMPAQELLSEIHDLVHQIMPAEREEKLLEICADLFWLDREIALRLVKKVLGQSTADSMDWLLVQLAIRLAPSREFAETIIKYISDEKLRNFARGLSIGLANTSIDELFSEIGGLRDVSAKLYFIYAWCVNNNDDEGTLFAIKRALEIITAAPDYSPSMRVLRQFAQLLEDLKVTADRSIIDRFDILRQAALQRPIEEAVWLQCALAACESTMAKEAGENRLYQTYLELDEMVEPTELDARLAGLARIYAYSRKVIPSDVRFRDELRDEIQRVKSKLLSTSADHFAITKGALVPLAESDIQLALDLASELNIAMRRDQAYRWILLRYARSGDPSNLDFELLLQAISQISEARYQDKTFIDILYEVRSTIGKWKNFSWETLLQRIEAIHNSDLKSLGYALAYKAASVEQQNEIAPKCADLTRTTWQQIDNPWEKLQTGFAIVRIMAEMDKGIAAAFLEEVERQKQISGFSVEVFAKFYVFCLRLCIRCLADLFKSDEGEHAKHWIMSKVERLNSVSMECDVLNELALAFYSGNRHATFQQIVRDHILLRLQNEHSKELWSKAVVGSAPSLYVYERALFRTYLDDLPRSFREEAIRRTFLWLLTGATWQPIDIDRLVIHITQEQVLQCLDVIKLVQTDVLLYNLIEILIDQLVTKDNAGRIRLAATVTEKLALAVARELRNIIEEKLPDASNIKHDGYKVVCLAQLARLCDAAQQTPPYRARDEWRRACPPWNEIKALAYSIPNVADRALVLGECGALAYDCDAAVGKVLLEESRKSIEDIPNAVDRAERLYLLASQWRKVDSLEAAKFTLKEAMNVLQVVAWDEARDRITGLLIELCHSIDPDLAAQLASRVDNVVVRSRIEADLEAEKLKHGPSSVTRDSRVSRHVLGAAAYRLLRALWSGTGLVNPETIGGEWLKWSLGGRFSDVQWVVAWFVEESLRRTRPAATSSLDEWWRRMRQWIDMVERVANQLIGARSIPSYGVEELATVEGVQMFRAGEREKALGFLRQWLSCQDHECVKICDPYFSVSELELIKHIGASVRTYILTSWKAQRLKAGDKDIERIYRETWYKICDQEPPQVHIAVVGVPSTGDSPLHDRCIISAVTGLELGTSINGLGNKDSWIRTIENNERQLKEREFDKMLTSPPRYFNGERLIMHQFTL